MNGTRLNLYKVHSIFCSKKISLLIIQIKRSTLGPSSTPSLPFEYGYELCCQAQEVAQTCIASGHDEPVFVPFGSALNPIRGTKK
jgi:hypothetical protein